MSNSKSVEGQAFRGSVPVASPPSTAHSEGENEFYPWEVLLPGMVRTAKEKMTKELWGEFVNMARAADRWNQHCKEMKGE